MFRVKTMLGDCARELPLLLSSFRWQTGNGVATSSLIVSCSFLCFVLLAADVQSSEADAAALDSTLLVEACKRDAFDSYQTC